MRIARFTAGDDPLFGVVTGELDEFGQAADDSVVVELVGDPLYSGIQPTQTEHRLADVRLLAPVIPRSKVVAIGKNYAAHAAEMGGEVPEEPLMFLKPNTSVIGPGDPILYPPQSQRVDYEGELAVVIGRHLPRRPARAGDRRDPRLHDRQRRDRPRPAEEGRAVDPRQGLRLVLPARPVDRDRPRPARLRRGPRVQTHLNGDLVQDGSTKDLIFDIPTLVAHVTSVMTLLPGDVILTGTPEGVGPMQPGDEVEVSIEGLGALTNTVVRR